MAFEDDMIEAGYSDEQEYLERLMDDFEEHYSSQVGRDDDYDYDSSYDEEELNEIRSKQKKEKQWVDDWKTNNPDLAIIWNESYITIKYYAELSNMDNRHFMGLNEYNELKRWLKGRELFEINRHKKEWRNLQQELFSLYKNELFMFYFPEDDNRIDMAHISQQASELSSIEFYEPELWEFVISCYGVNPNLFETIEEDAFWNEFYNREMDYEYWKDTNIDQYNYYAKEWISNSNTGAYWNWKNEHEAEENEWKNKNHELWEKYKANYEIREKNKFIESKIEEFNGINSKEKNKNDDIWDIEYEDDFDEDDIVALDYSLQSIHFLPDIEKSSEIPFDESTLDLKCLHFIKDTISSFDIEKISKESSAYADKVLTQLWIYINRDAWEMNELKKRHNYLFKFEKKYSKEFLLWWKEKYPEKWDEFLHTVVPKFKTSLEIVQKFRLWAFDGNKEKFIALADKYFPYWNKTLKLILGQDIHNELCVYFYNQIGHSTDFWGEGVDYIKKCTSIKHEIDVWQKELQDKVIWNYFYEKRNFGSIISDHIFLDSMYSSLYNKE